MVTDHPNGRKVTARPTVCELADGCRFDHSCPNYTNCWVAMAHEQSPIEPYAPTACSLCGALPGVMCACVGRRIESREVQPKPREPGPVELAVERDLEALADKIKGGKYALAALARKLSRVIDARGDEEAPSQLAKAGDTLRITMNQIAAGEEVDAGVQEQLQRLLSSPSAGGSTLSAEIRYPKKP